MYEVKIYTPDGNDTTHTFDNEEEANDFASKKKEGLLGALVRKVDSGLIAEAYGVDYVGDEDPCATVIFANMSTWEEGYVEIVNVNGQFEQTGLIYVSHQIVNFPTTKIDVGEDVLHKLHERFDDLDFSNPDHRLALLQEIYAYAGGDSVQDRQGESDVVVFVNEDGVMSEYDHEEWRRSGGCPSRAFSESEYLKWLREKWVSKLMG